MKKLFILLVFIALTVSLSAQTVEEAMASYKAGEYDKAIRICGKMLDENSENGEALVILGWSYIKQEKYGEALETADRVLGIKEDSRALETAGISCFYLRDNKKALEYFNRYIKADPEGRYIDDVYSLMGDVYMRLREYNNADIAYSAAVHYYAASPRWWYKLGYAREKAGSVKAALKAYEKALALNPSYTDALEGKARIEN